MELDKVRRQPSMLEARSMQLEARIRSLEEALSFAWKRVSELDTSSGLEGDFDGGEGNCIDLTKREGWDDHVARCIKKRLEEIDRAEVQNLSWSDLDTLAEHQPGMESTRFERLRCEVEEALASGMDAARLVSGYQQMGPADMLKFLQIHRGVTEEWRPAGPTEQGIVDMLVQTRWMYERWMKTHAEQLTGECLSLSPSDEEKKKYGRWFPPRVRDMEALDHSMNTALRFQNQYIKLVRALRDLRRYAPTMTIHAGQVNVANQQVNLASH
ncbi:MAG TPA: hypothetical protein VK934_13295 [Fimbriimonas sp.]|nr:hypothetical protein [Fimbriimonas sp.]